MLLRRLDIAADEIPLSVLKREQDRIIAELDQVNRRIDAHFGDYADARAHLDDALGLLTNCADIYTRCDDTNRRLCNQAFFTKVYIDEDNELRVEYNRPFEMLLDPQVNANALDWVQDSDKARTRANDSIGKGSSLVRGVEPTGLEPVTPCLQSRCATNCAKAPRAARSGRCAIGAASRGRCRTAGDSGADVLGVLRGGIEVCELRLGLGPEVLGAVGLDLAPDQQARDSGACEEQEGRQELLHQILRCWEWA